MLPSMTRMRRLPLLLLWRAQVVGTRVASITLDGECVGRKIPHRVRADQSARCIGVVEVNAFRSAPRGDRIRCQAALRRHAKRIAATEVARFRLETPGRIGRATR
jgi:hypothetical protein